MRRKIICFSSGKWRKQYPSCVKSWEDNWETLSTFYESPPEVRKIIYMTNIIEGLNRQFCQITKTSPALPLRIPCAGCSTWPLGASPSAGVHTAPLAGTRGWQGIQPAACALSFALFPDFVEFRFFRSSTGFIYRGVVKGMGILYILHSWV